MSKECLACDILKGVKSIPGGFIHQTGYWSVEPCIGPFPAGTIILKPIRHVLNFSELEDNELEEYGKLLRLVTRVITQLTECDQTYICQWSHAGWEPVHIHFVIQPAWNNQQNEYQRPGPYMQNILVESGIYPDNDEVINFVKKAKDLIKHIGG